MVTVNELLQPLFHRLHDIETRNVSLYTDDFIKNAQANLERIKKDLYSVGNRGLLIDDLKRIQKKIELLLDPNFNYSGNSISDFPFDMSAEEVNAKVVEELSLYNKAIKGFLVELNAESNLDVTVFQLTGDLTADKFQKSGFKPALSSKATACFLNLLRECNLLPNYSDDTLSDLAAILLGRSKQNVRVQLGKIRNEKKNGDIQNDLHELKAQIEKLMHLIDSKIVDK